MIRGVLLPIITPFDDKVHVDEQMMRQLVDFHIKAGVQGLFVLGSTGQGPAMTTEERHDESLRLLESQDTSHFRNSFPLTSWITGCNIDNITPLKGCM